MDKGIKLVNQVFLSLMAIFGLGIVGFHLIAWLDGVLFQITPDGSFYQGNEMFLAMIGALFFLSSMGWFYTQSENNRETIGHS